VYLILSEEMGAANPRTSRFARYISDVWGYAPGAGSNRASCKDGEWIRMAGTESAAGGARFAGQQSKQRDDCGMMKEVRDEQPVHGVPGEQQHKCVTVIFNPVSGTGDPERRKRRIESLLAQHRLPLPAPGDNARAGRALPRPAGAPRRGGSDRRQRRGWDRGTGDERLVGTNVSLAIFPAGTGNLLSVNLKIPTEAPQAVHAALFGVKRPLDLARLSTDTGWQTYFAIVGGAGYDALIMRDADRRAKRRLGLFAYLLAALRNLNNESFIAHITLEEGAGGNSAGPLFLRRRARSVMVANMGRLQGGLTLVPGAWPDDGRLELTILKAETLWDWLRLVGNALRGRIAEDPAVEYHAARRVHVRFGSQQPLQHDGEPAGPARAFSAEIVPGAVQVMVPTDAPV
jgi:diacylglycerol kinase family enzyme